MNMKTDALDESKIASYIRTESTKLYIFLRKDIPGNLRDFCRRIKWQIRQNINEDTETAGFDVKWKSDKGEPFGCRLVDRSTQIPCTKWHSRYDLALKELYSIVEK